jgi:hypothetical protein
MNVADADLSTVQEMGNAQPCRISKCLERRFETHEFVTLS